VDHQRGSVPLAGAAHRGSGLRRHLSLSPLYRAELRHDRRVGQRCEGARQSLLPYMGTTNGSAEGLLFWDGAPYLQAALGPLTIYTLFTQATNYPIGAATASP